MTAVTKPCGLCVSPVANPIADPVALRLDCMTHPDALPALLWGY